MFSRVEWKMEVEGSEIAKNIINQAPDWNFGGDCLILQWMEQISQNLETRAKKTTESLDKLKKNIGSAKISLENTQNSLNALQYTQYVEMRCQDDEFCIDAENIKEKLEEKPKKDILKVFLENNLNMLHNCHDKFNFLEDSDEDEAEAVASGENCIYQPRNPYNERLLPHIYGTKMWKENWHVGLCEEGMQNYSGDEQSDVYSLSSSSSVENDSMESHNTENISQWASSVSLNHEISNYSNKMDNYLPPASSMPASTILDLPFPELVRSPGTIQNNINDETVQSVEEQRKTAKSVSNNILESSLASGATKKIPVQSKTLNLFDDNDFKNLMSEISENVQTKHHIAPKPSERVSTNKPKVDIFASRNNSPIAESNVPKLPTFPQVTETFTQKIAIVNLFDSPTDELPPVDHSEHSTAKSKVDLFADLDNNANNRPNFLTDSLINAPSKIEKKSMISAKSLFEDDFDGDDDFLSIFSKSKSKSDSSGTSTHVLQNEEKHLKIKPSSTMFFDDDGDENDFIFPKPDRPATYENVENVPKEDAKKYETIAPSIEKPKSAQEKNIFMDDNDDNENDSMFSQADENKISENMKADSLTHEEASIVKRVKNDANMFKNIPKTIPRSGSIFEDKPNPMPAFMALEPPKDFEETRKIQSSTALKQKSFDDGEDYEDFISLFAGNKSKTKTKDITGAEDCDSTSLPAKNPLTSIVPEDILSSNSKPAEITATSSKSVINTKIPENDNMSVPNTKSTSEKASLSTHEILLGSGVPEGISGLNIESVIIAKSVDSVSKGKSLIDEAYPSKNKASYKEHTFKIVKKAEVSLTDEKQYETADMPSPQASEELSHPNDYSEVPKVIPNETSEDISPTPESNNQIPPFKSPAYDSYSALFLDEPPDDVDFFATKSTSVNVPQSNFESDFYEPTKNKIRSSNETKPEDPATQKSASYNIGLFSEVPPEDEESNDGFIKPTSKQTSSDLDSLTVTTDIFEKLHVKENNKQVHQTMNIPKSVSNKYAPQKDEPQDIPKKATVSKLKTPSININVQALLPNAGVKLKIGNSEIVKNDFSPVEPPQPSQNISLHNEQRLEAGRENILPSLCKNRVRGPLKRRPSTRAGRQESYRQTLENEREEQNKEQSIESKKMEKSSKVDHAGHAKSSLSSAKNIESKTLETTRTLPSLPVSTAYQYQPPSHSQISTGSNLFDDFDDNENNDDFFSNPINPKNSKVVKEKVAEKLTSVALESDDDLVTTSGAKQTKTQKEPQQMSKSKPKKLEALFGSDSNEDDEIDLFRTLNMPKAAVKVTSNAPKESKGKSKSLFSDSEDDDGDLFGSSAAKTKKADSTKSIAAPVKKTTLDTQSLTGKTKSSASTNTDNPLADLLDF